MNFIYNIGIYLANFVLHCSSGFNTKIKSGIDGRKQSFKTLQSSLTPNDKTLWFHCASLGEYEQGLPIFEALRKQYTTHKIVLTFFSPSGYEVRKNTPIADVVVYLPMDTPKNAERFINLLQPELTVFVKYDIWPNYLNKIKKHQLRAILISAAFRENQLYFKPFGKPLRDALFAFEHIFTQNEVSKTLLESINFNHVTVSGDTRFDRVSNQLKQDNTLPFVEEFKSNQLCVVIGSSWPEDEVLLTEYINNQAPKNVKFIIAPHDIKSSHIKNIEALLKVPYVLFSKKDNTHLQSASVFIIDTIGLLTKIYNYADIAYVGGAMGNTGLHNTLEPAVFGVPVVIGKNYDKFPEAKDLINNGGMFSIANQTELKHILDELINNEVKRLDTGTANATFIMKNKGAVIQILDYLRIYK
ncbi:3-deoxy-D-manno-octulosonic acid transferase [Tamlana crocina]|uniref:3-deoxy-D-manno-octulosonic acid transferase n=1 Tax=Tamlana crocina TaxID=393006 RepID=A0ABX1D7Z8_9FLAO|nr:glycosyltransferase N-terminal domain-containing protein [Tamlana crocina]NJX14485.1 3-deoxy-D-manno-octulosonic acid transferase [Tamlana crocina]